MTKPHAVVKSQICKFADLARELECDVDEADFEEAVKKVATKKSDPQATKSEHTK